MDPILTDSSLLTAEITTTEADKPTRTPEPEAEDTAAPIQTVSAEARDGRSGAARSGLDLSPLNAATEGVRGRPQGDRTTFPEAVERTTTSVLTIETSHTMTAIYTSDGVPITTRTVLPTTLLSTTVLHWFGDISSNSTDRTNDSQFPVEDWDDTSTGDSEDGKLPVGAYVAIGVVCGIAAIVIPVGIWYFLKCRRKRRAKEGGGAGVAVARRRNASGNEQGTAVGRWPGGPVEMPPNHPSVVPTAARRQSITVSRGTPVVSGELDSRPVPAELESPEIGPNERPPSYRETAEARNGEMTVDAARDVHRADRSPVYTVLN